MFLDRLDIGAASRLTTISEMTADSIGTQMMRDIAGDLRIRVIRRQTATRTDRMIAGELVVTQMKTFAGVIKQPGMRRW